MNIGGDYVEYDTMHYYVPLATEVIDSFGEYEVIYMDIKEGGSASVAAGVTQADDKWVPDAYMNGYKSGTVRKPVGMIPKEIILADTVIPMDYWYSNSYTEYGIIDKKAKRKWTKQRKFTNKNDYEFIDEEKVPKPKKIEKRVRGG